MTRGGYYNDWLKYFKLTEETDDELSCKDMKPFDDESWGSRRMYWSNAGSDDGKCYPTSGATKYTMNSPEDYKRCVCDKHVEDMKKWSDCMQDKKEWEITEYPK